MPQTMPYLFVPLIALGVGGSFTLGMVLPLDHARDANEANSWTALVLGIGYFAGASGPFFLGVARDSTGASTFRSRCCLAPRFSTCH
ncbi:hypothetical protein [Ensifer aridi]|uniref:hypothetical protein n=1 Tax=Ensifer aridi TaxID=1708715 RepID=UPI00042755CC|nr:hypothetical protein [Ensifer aridi]